MRERRDLRSAIPSRSLGDSRIVAETSGSQQLEIDLSDIPLPMDLDVNATQLALLSPLHGLVLRTKHPRLQLLIVAGSGTPQPLALQVVNRSRRCLVELSIDGQIGAVDVGPGVDLSIRSGALGNLTLNRDSMLVQGNATIEAGEVRLLDDCTLVGPLNLAESYTTVEGATILVSGKVALRDLRGSYSAFLNPREDTTADLVLGRIGGAQPSEGFTLVLGERVSLTIQEAVTSELFVSGPGGLVLDHGVSLTQALSLGAGDAGIGRLTVEKDVDAGTIRGHAESVSLGAHAHLSPDADLTVRWFSTVHPQCTIDGVTLSGDAEQSLDALSRVLPTVQRASIKLGQFGSSSLDRSEALRIERVVVAGDQLSTHKAEDARVRHEWHVQRLRIQRALTTSLLDRMALTVRIAVGDSYSVGRSLLAWLVAVAAAVPLMALGLGYHRLDLDHAASWARLLHAVELCVFSVFRLQPVAGVDGTSLPTPASWTIWLKVPLTLLLALLVASIVRRVRWKPSEVPREDR